MDAPLVVGTAEQLQVVLAAARRADVLALDVEGDGLYAYRARLCTVQLAWEDADGVTVAIVDTIAVDPRPMRDLLGPDGPVKLLHDLTFDARLLAEADVRLANVRDTSVMARMLGRKATGLASLLGSELGLTLSKGLQQHDWGKRPLGREELEYLAADVSHLAALERKLVAEVSSAGIEREVAEECVFKLESAFAPPREKRAAYLRIKGGEVLDALGLAVLRRLVEEREQIAMLWNVPPFKVAGNELLLELAVQRPASAHELRRIRRGISGRLATAVDRLAAAIARGVADGKVPDADRAEPDRPDRALLVARRASEKRLSTWRRAEAAARSVDEQVVLPGHCLQDIVLLDGDLAGLSGVRGLGAVRLERYADVLACLVRGDPVALPVPAAGGTVSTETSAIGEEPGVP